jgi:hypothetical protein
MIRYSKWHGMVHKTILSWVVREELPWVAFNGNRSARRGETPLLRKVLAPDPFKIRG